jgi:8-oxo-dGTP diphosphatase
MIRNSLEQRSVDAAVLDAELAMFEFDGARRWFSAALAAPLQPLGAEVWVFDPGLEHVVLVKHRWRAWVPPGGEVERGETPREGAARELLEETGLRVDLLDIPAAAAVRSFHPDLPATLSLSYAAIAPGPEPLVAEDGQPAAWTRLDRDWASYFPDDRDRIREYVKVLTQRSAG